MLRGIQRTLDKILQVIGIKMDAGSRLRFTPVCNSHSHQLIQGVTNVFFFTLVMQFSLTQYLHVGITILR